MSLKSAVKRMESRLGVDDDHEVIIYGFPNEDGTVDVLHVSKLGSRVEIIDQTEYNRRWAESGHQKAHSEAISAGDI